MQHIILGYSQEKAIEYGLDLKDLMILRFIFNFINSNSLHTRVIDGIKFFYISSSYIIDELPMLEIKSKDVLRRRIKKLIDLKLLDYRLCQDEGGYTFYILGENYEDLIFKSDCMDNSINDYEEENKDKYKNAEETEVDNGNELLSEDQIEERYRNEIQNKAKKFCTKGDDKNSGRGSEFNKVATDSKSVPKNTNAINTKEKDIKKYIYKKELGYGCKVDTTFRNIMVKFEDFAIIYYWSNIDYAKGNILQKIKDKEQDMTKFNFLGDIIIISEGRERFNLLEIAYKNLASIAVKEFIDTYKVENENIADIGNIKNQIDKIILKYANETVGVLVDRKIFNIDLDVFMDKYYGKYLEEFTRIFKEVEDKYLNMTSPQEFNNSEILDELSMAVFYAIYNMRYALGNALNECLGEDIEEVNDEDKKEANSIFNNIKSRDIDVNDKIRLLKNLIYLNPYMKEVYDYAISEFGDKDGEIQEIANNFNINLDSQKEALVEGQSKTEIEESINSTEIEESINDVEIDDKDIDNIEIDNTEIDNVESLKNIINKLRNSKIESISLEYNLSKLSDALDKLAKRERTVEDITYRTREEAEIAKNESLHMEKLLAKANKNSKRELLNAKNKILEINTSTDIWKNYVDKIDKNIEKIRRKNRIITISITSLIILCIIVSGVTFKIISDKNEAKLQSEKIAKEAKKAEESKAKTDKEKSASDSKKDTESTNKNKEGLPTKVNNINSTEAVVTDNGKMRNLKVDNAVATSTLIDNTGTSYSPLNVVDHKSNTIWAEGSLGPGVNDTLSLYFFGDAAVSKIYMINGSAKSDRLYYANNRVKTLRVDFSYGESKIVTLNDGVLGEQEIDLGAPIKTESIKFTILSVYKGNQYDDTCISEVRPVGY